MKGAQLEQFDLVHVQSSLAAAIGWVYYTAATQHAAQQAAQLLIDYRGLLYCRNTGSQHATILLMPSVGCLLVSSGYRHEGRACAAHTERLWLPCTHYSAFSTCTRFGP